MGGQQISFYIRADSDGRQSGCPCYESVQHHRQAAGRASNVKARQGRQIQSAHFGQRVHRVLPGRLADTDAFPYDLHLAVVAGSGQTSPPARHQFRVHIKKHGKQGAAGSGIADSHFPGASQHISPFLQFHGHICTCLHGPHCLLHGHGRFLQEILCPICHFPVHHAGNRVAAGHTHIHRNHVGPCLASHEAYTRISPGHIPRHNGGNLLPCLGHPFLYNAIIPTHDHNSPGTQADCQAAGSSGNAYDILLQDSQASQRFGHLVPALLCLLPECLAGRLNAVHRFLQCHSSCSSPSCSCPLRSCLSCFRSCLCPYSTHCPANRRTSPGQEG